MKKDTLFLLGLVGLGLYLYYRHKKPVLQDKTASNTNSSIPVNETGVPIEQKLDIRQNYDVRNQLNDNDYTAYFSLSGYKKLGNIPNTI
jgi:hypothetical protein